MTELKASTEPHGTASRTTQDGRKIAYEMSVIQQPERARACGSGAKSSTDRRPVDPPPIVKLNIFQGDGQNRQDITGRYNANFFLYATLESATPAAQGPVSATASTPNCPVLTGVPVAALYYLERPEKAGYFIFSDISVRHEGMYKLAFTLYEETKEDRDKDWTPTANFESIPLLNPRLKIKSKAFQVFSAKKFPGLFESTTLSRLVADQGCRVRIRRDIRLRKHETKTKEWDNNVKPEEWESYEKHKVRDQSQPNVTPEGHSSAPHQRYDPSERPRSTSEASAKSYSTSRRHSSSQESGNHYHYSHGPPKTPPTPMNTVPAQATHNPSVTYPQSQFDTTSQASRSHTAFHFQPQYQYGNPFNMPQPYGYINHAGSHHPDTEPQFSHYRHSSNGNNGFAAPSQYGNNAYGYTSYGSTDYGELRPPVRTQPHAPTHLSHTPAAISNPHPLPSVAVNDTMLPPIKDLKRPGEIQEHPTTYCLSTETFPPASGIGHERTKYPGSASHKRSFGSAFDTQHIEQPLYDGDRPKVPQWASTTVVNALDNGKPRGSEDTEDFEQFRLSYRRADGTEMTRLLPNFD